MNGPGEPTTLRATRRDAPSPSRAGHTLRRDDRRNRITAPIAAHRRGDIPRPDLLVRALPRALLGLVVIACMVLGVAAADGDPFDMLAAGAMGLIVTVLMMALWAALDVWRQRVR